MQFFESEATQIDQRNRPPCREEVIVRTFGHNINYLKGILNELKV